MKDLTKYLKPQSKKGLAAVKAKTLGVAPLEIENNRQMAREPVSQWVMEGEAASPRQRHDSDDSHSEGVQLDEDGDIDLPLSPEPVPAKPSTVFRDHSGKVINISTYQSKEAQRRVENEEQLAQWGSGLVQKAEKRSLAERFAEEVGKPFSRYEIEKDADEELKKRERFGDPLAAFGAKKQKKAEDVPECSFQGSNRFGIAAGARWDGIDRSNGFEVRYMAALAERKAKAPEDYREANLDM